MDRHHPHSSSRFSSFVSTAPTKSAATTAWSQHPNSNLFYSTTTSTPPTPPTPSEAAPTSFIGKPTITPAIEHRLQLMCDRHAHLVKHLTEQTAREQLSSQEIAKLEKELSELDDIVSAVDAWKRIKKTIEELLELAQDEGEDDAMKDMAREEASTLVPQVSGIERKLLLSLLPKDGTDDRGVVLEVRAGTGGEEACLFAAELFRMYERYATARGWKFEVAEFGASDMGGCKLASATISSSSGSGGIYGRLKFESGVHRVQRVPATESGGRVHTSAASVAVLPQAEELDVSIREEDLRIDVYRAGGAGGQHVNTTNSAVRITHIPTGLSVAIQDERSQHKNKAKALRVLRARIFDAERVRAEAAQSSARKQQMGSGDRSERVRTYNFPHGRVTDHRVGVTEHGMEGVMGGEKLDVFIEALQIQYQADVLATFTTTT